MAKIQGPLLSMGGSGQIGHSQVYATWKGRPYARRYVIPANPQSTEQTKTRTVFSLLNDMWRLAPASFQAPWTAFASGKVLTNRNAFVSRNIKLLRPKGFPALDTLEGLFFSPGAKGGLSAAPVITTPATNIVFTTDPPDPLPSGWTVVGYIGAAVAEQDPQAGGQPEILVDSAVDPGPGNPWVVALTVPAAGDYSAAAWFVFQRSASSTDLAYGPATGQIVTV